MHLESRAPTRLPPDPLARGVVVVPWRAVCAWAGLVPFLKADSALIEEFHVSLESPYLGDLVKATPSGDSVVMHVAHAGDVEACRLLLRRANVRGIVGAANKRGQTATDIAIARGHFQIADMLSTYHKGHIDSSNLSKALLRSNSRINQRHSHNNLVSLSNRERMEEGRRSL
ncbi:hypothetical protein M885DRAFT_499543 [Pelagophyceae sp. CCMP2097]|nr:hypothetical protein M885DRAFT_499543 [Pelagophyceae sp. CCMP2097]